VHCPTSTTTSTTTTCRDVASAPLMFSSQLDYLQVKIRCHVSGQASIVRRQVLEVGSDQIWITKWSQPVSNCDESQRLSFQSFEFLKIF
jgi:hypothetical protein